MQCVTRCNCAIIKWMMHTGAEWVASKTLKALKFCIKILDNVPTSKYRSLTLKCSEQHMHKMNDAC